MKKSILVISTILALTLMVGCNNNSDVNNNNNNNNNQGGNQQNNNVVVNNQDQEKELPTTNIKGEETLDTLTFSNIKIVEEGENQNLLTATVTNNGTEDIASKILDIELFTEDNQSIGIVGAILPDVPASGSATMEVPIALGVMNTNNIKIRYSGN